MPAVLSPNPINLKVGDPPFALVPTKQDGTDLPIAQCVITQVAAGSLPASVVTISYDLAAGKALLTAVGPGGANARWEYTDDGIVVASATFSILVASAVTEVGHRPG